MKSRQTHPCLATCTLILSAFTGFIATADTALFEWGINRDGIITGIGDSLPPGSVFNTDTGLGQVNLVFTGTGVRSGVFYVDHELSTLVNTFFNEFGTVSGSPLAGQSWEIDEPGFSSDPGDIFDNFLAGSLDNSVGKIDPDDVSMALGWNFVLNAGETGTIRFLLSESAPVEGFYLRQLDPDSKESIYFSSSLSIVGGPVIPETLSIVPSSVLALAATGVVWRQRRSRITKRS